MPQSVVVMITLGQRSSFSEPHSDQSEEVRAVDAEEQCLSRQIMTPSAGGQRRHTGGERVVVGRTAPWGRCPPFWGSPPRRSALPLVPVDPAASTEVVGHVGSLEVLNPFLPDPASSIVAAIYLTAKNTGSGAASASCHRMGRFSLGSWHRGGVGCW